MVWETGRVLMNCQIVRLLSEGVVHVAVSNMLVFVSILNGTTLKYTGL